MRQNLTSTDRLYTSESDVHRRQILTYKDGPRAGKVYVTDHQCALQSDKGTFELEWAEKSQE